jgi:nicotinamidase-related amidase
MNRALIVIDMQNDFCHPNGALTTKEAQEIVPQVIKLVDEFRNSGEAIFYTLDTHDSDYMSTQEGQKLPVMHCQYGSWGWRIIDGVDLIHSSEMDNVYHLMKNTFAYNDWGSIQLDQYDEIIICGLVSSICVIANAIVIKSLYPELPIKFAAYTSAGLTPENHKAAIEVMRSNQIEVLE